MQILKLFSLKKLIMKAKWKHYWAIYSLKTVKGAHGTSKKKNASLLV